jgi:hypothetical protein
LPEDNLAKLFRNASLALERLKDAVVALLLVFITIGMVGLLLDPRSRTLRTSCPAASYGVALSCDCMWVY